MMACADTGVWLRRDSPSIGSIAIETEDGRDHPTIPIIPDPRTRVLLGLLALLGPEDRELIESTADGATVSEVSRRQGLSRAGLSHRRTLLVDWLAYCAPITLAIEPVLAGLTLSVPAQRWWVWHVGGTGVKIAALERSHPSLVVVRARWAVPVRSRARAGFA